MITFEKQNIQKKHGNSRFVAIYVFVTVMFACLFLLQEQTYAVSCYTDTWVDDSGVSDQPYYEDEPADGPYIVGSGVTSMRGFVAQMFNSLTNYFVLDFNFVTVRHS